jgi:hypothetical protein
MVATTSLLDTETQIGLITTEQHSRWYRQDDEKKYRVIGLKLTIKESAVSQKKLSLKEAGTSKHALNAFLLLTRKC